MTAGFSMMLTRVGSTASHDPGRAYDDEFDDVSSVIEDACAILGESGAVRFSVSGFSDTPWPVDVATDLSVVLEQLPDAIKKAREGKDFVIDFYEQGIERTLHFHHQGDSTKIECSSRHATWTPSPSSLIVEPAQLEAMLRTLAANFLRSLEEVSPALARHEWIRSWSEQAGLSTSSPPVS